MLAASQARRSLQRREGVLVRKVKSSVYVVFPAAPLDGWEVVKEPSDESVGFDTQEEAITYARAQARLHGGASIWFENWHGDREGLLELTSHAGAPGGLESLVFSGLLRRRDPGH